jgi:hypothetical protein
MSDPTSKHGQAQVRIQGLQDFQMKMRELPVNLQKKVLRTLLRDSMKLVREDARVHAPSLTTAVIGPDGTPRRLPGTVRKAISVRTSKAEAGQGNVGVFVNVRPLAGIVYRGPKGGRVLVRKSRRGADNPRDPYYWRWLEFGTGQRSGKRAGSPNRGAVRAYRFLHSAASRLSDVVGEFAKKMSAWVNQADQSGKIE